MTQIIISQPPEKNSVHSFGGFQRTVGGDSIEAEARKRESFSVPVEKSEMCVEAAVLVRFRMANWVLLTCKCCTFLQNGHSSSNLGH